MRKRHNEKQILAAEATKEKKTKKKKKEKKGDGEGGIKKHVLNNEYVKLLIFSYQMPSVKFFC